MTAAPQGLAGARSRVMTNCCAPSRNRREIVPAHWLSPRHDSPPRDCCTAPPYRSGAISMTTFATATHCFPAAATTKTGSRSICARSTVGGCVMHEVETPELLEVQLVNAIAPYILNAR
jgi:hypothetical protein